MTWVHSFLIVVAFAMLAVLMNQLSPQVVNGVRLFNGFIISWMLVWLIRDMSSYKRLLLSHRKDLLAVFRHDEEKRAQEFEELKVQTASIAERLALENKGIADRLAIENHERHQQLTQTIADLKKPDHPS